MSRGLWARKRQVECFLIATFYFVSIRECVRGVCHCASGSERCRNHRGFDKFGVARACLTGVTSMDVDAVRTLRRASDCDRDQLLIFYRDCSFGDRRFVERQNAFITSGARLSIFFSLARLFLLYIDSR